MPADRNVSSSATPPTPLPVTLDQVSKEWLTQRLSDIEGKANKDVVVIMGVIMPNLDVIVRMALEHLKERRSALLVILDTPGGFVETAERISDTLRHFYKTVDFLIPDKAMSAGTVLALSGDAIWMDYFSRLGPIDPQEVGQDGRMIPGLSYLRQYESLIQASKEGALTEAELTLLTKLDLAKLHQIDLAASLSVSLIKQWLPRHKFKDWQKDGKPVDEKKKEERAKEIADALNNHQKWGTHGRGIHMDVLSRDLRLKIDNFGDVPGLKDAVWDYFWAAREFVRKGEYQFFAHSRSFI